MPYLLRTGETRVWRTYCGGAALSRWHGRQEDNSQFPEDWAASTTRAVNPGREHVLEGFSRVLNVEGMPYLADVIAADPVAFFGQAHVERFGAKAGFLVKLIDAGERLTIQVHPDRQYAKTVFHSDYGKTESWYILGSNSPQAQPCIYMGFVPGVTREHFAQLFRAQDITGMLSCLHRIPVSAGDCFFIEAGVPHAIGEGCFLAEVQEPTDYTMRVELTTPGGLHINEKQCHQGVGYEKMLDCFHYDGVTREEALSRWQAQPKQIKELSGGTISSLIDERKTKLFSMRVIDIHGEMTLAKDTSMSILMTLDGVGEITCAKECLTLRQGDVLAVRADAPALTVNGCVRLLQSFPPRP